MASDLVHPRLQAALRPFFPQRCTVRRATVTTDALGADVHAWADRATGLVCRLTTKVERNPVSALAEDPLIISEQLVIAQDADVTPGDQVADVVDAATGQLIDAGPWQVLGVAPSRPGNSVLLLTLELERVR